MAVVGILAIQNITPAILALVAALPVGLMAGGRKAFSVTWAIGAPVAFLAALWAITAIVALTRDWPVLMLAVVFCIYFIAVYVTRRTGSAFGMLILVVAALMSIMGMKEPMARVRLHVVLPASDILIAVAAIFVLVFPTRERVTATLYGADAALLIVMILPFSTHFEALVLLIFLVAMLLADRMIHGHHEAMV